MSGSTRLFTMCDLKKAMKKNCEIYIYHLTAIIDMGDGGETVDDHGGGIEDSLLLFFFCCFCRTP